MRTYVVCLLCSLVVYMLHTVSGQPDACDNVLSAVGGGARARSRGRRRSTLLNIAHGNPRTENCPFLRDAVGRSGGGNCVSRLRITCPLPARRAAAAFGTAGVDFSVVPNACSTSVPVCNSSSIYRTMDGSCNNVQNPEWGQAGSPQRRLVTNAYDDGDDGTPLECCGVDQNNENCDPIIVPNTDTHFPPGSCLDFPRSDAAYDCFGIRQVINSQSSWFDLSTVYGSSIVEAQSLRSEMGDGKLKHNRNKLTVDFTDSTCVLSRPFDPVHYYCPLAGDGRVIEQPGLASMHTIFMREHNRLAEGLARVNPHWDDERLYQEARKNNIGQWQHIMYSEYLPTVLGRGVIRRFNLQVARRGFNNNYNPDVDATISNAFAVAVFRYGHSQVHDLLGSLNSFNQLFTQPLERHFFEPAWYHENNGTGLENVLNWVTQTGCPFTDRKVQDSIRQNLFLDIEGNSLDLAALNIHRGREHGIQGYNAFRRLCGLSDVTGPGGLVDHDFETARLLRETYNGCLGDIDLFTGMLSERRTNDGSLLGPTWQCLLASEFRRLRNGDRFFYEKWDPLNPDIGFTEAQVNSIKTIRVSNIICQNTDKNSMQRYGLYKPNRGWNRLINCRSRSFAGVDLNLWRERTSMGY